MKRFVAFSIVILGFVILAMCTTKLDLGGASFTDFRPSLKSVNIPQISCPIDKDGDGIDDLRDIVTFDYPYEHIAIISDKRRADGVPYLLHNAGPTASETDKLLSWPSSITGHFRFPSF